MAIDRKHGLAIGAKVDQIRQRYPAHAEMFMEIMNVVNDLWKQVAGEGGLADPGASGIVKRTSEGVTTVATAGTDYQAAISFPLALGSGGTGQTTALAAFNALSPTTTLGDISYHDGTDDVRLAGNITATRKCLTQTGNGSVSAAAAWGEPATPPRCMAYNSSGQTIAASTNVDLTFDSELYDSGGLHSTSSNTSRFTVPSDGVYRVVGQLRFTITAGVVAQLFVKVNGSAPSNGILQDYVSAALATQTYNVSGDLELTANDYVEFTAYQAGIGSTTTDATVTWGSVTRIGPKT